MQICHCGVFMYSRYRIYFEADFLLWKSTGCRNAEVSKGF